MGPQQVRYLAALQYKPNAIMRFLKVIERSIDKKEYRFAWGSCHFRRRLGIKLVEIADDDDNTTWSLSLGLGVCHLWIHLPKQLSRQHFSEPGQDRLRGWGAEFIEDSDDLYVQWNRASRFIQMPWSYEFHHKDIFMADGTWVREPRNKFYDVTADDEKLLDHIHNNKYQETVPYRYVLRNGTVQNVQATVTVDEMQWRRKWLPGTSLFAKTKRTIDVKFSGEVGERAGSYKGGTIGCSYEMQQDEDPIETLRRMERDRKFR